MLGWLTAAGGAVGAALVGVPGLALVLDPILRRLEGAGGWRDVASLENVPSDEPAAVPVVGDVVDAWTRARDQVLGTVFLRRKGDGEVHALTAECPHLGCKIAWSRAEARYFCPCHESAFSPDGEVLFGPSPRSMDPLETRVEDGRVLVRFKRFRTQSSERVEVG